MKIQDIPRPSLLALGVAGVAATALLGFAAGMALSRNPQALRRTAERVAREAATGLERATLLAAQAREQLGDLWAEARESARDTVDEEDFARAAAAAAAPAAAAPAASAAEPVAAPKPAARRKRAAGSGAARVDVGRDAEVAAPAVVARKRRTPAKPRKTPASAAPAGSGDEAAGD